MKKRLLALLIFAITIFSCFGCGSKEKKDFDTTTESKSNTETVVVTTTSTTFSSDRNTPEWVDSAVIYEMNVRQYTSEGTFDAAKAHLERLRNMGVTTIWLMPIYPISEVKRLGTLGSYYSIADYTAINPEFGTMEDFKKFVTECHSLGMTVVLDWVANHTGWDAKWITSNPEWYLKNSDGVIVHPPGTTWEDVAQLDYTNPEMRQGMIDAMKFWVRDLDIDGFRCDYASGVPLDFWEAARTELNTVKDIYMLAEDDSSKAFLINAFETNYNWKYYKGLTSVAKGANKADSLQNYINASKSLPAGSVTLNFIDNHDENSWNGTINSRLGDAALASTVLYYLSPGIPLIYSGQETGLDKSLEFFEKDEIKWDSFPYEKLLKTLSDIKQNNAALKNITGKKSLTFLTNDNKNIISFERVVDNNKVIVVINMSKDEQAVNITYNDFTNGNICLSGYGAPELIDGTIANADNNPKPVTLDELKAKTSLKPWEFIVISANAQ